MEPKNKGKHLNIILLGLLIVQIVIITGITIVTFLVPKPEKNYCAIATCNLDNYETYDQNGTTYLKFLDCQVQKKDQTIWQGTCSGYLNENN